MLATVFTFANSSRGYEDLGVFVHLENVVEIQNFTFLTGSADFGEKDLHRSTRLWYTKKGGLAQEKALVSSFHGSLNPIQTPSQTPVLCVSIPTYSLRDSHYHVGEQPFLGDELLDHFSDIQDFFAQTCCCCRVVGMYAPWFVPRHESPCLCKKKACYKHVSSGTF